MEILESSWGVLEAVWSCVGSIVAKFESTQVGQNKPIRLRSNEQVVPGTQRGQNKPICLKRNQLAGVAVLALYQDLGEQGGNLRRRRLGND